MMFQPQLSIAAVAVAIAAEQSGASPIRDRHLYSGAVSFRGWSGRYRGGAGQSGAISRTVFRAATSKPPPFPPPSPLPPSILLPLTRQYSPQCRRYVFSREEVGVVGEDDVVFGETFLEQCLGGDDDEAGAEPQGDDVVVLVGEGSEGAMEGALEMVPWWRLLIMGRVVDLVGGFGTFQRRSFKRRKRKKNRREQVI